jgi:quercetin dioxygenase-like cupin family protein
MPFINHEDLSIKTLLPGFSGKLIHGESMTIAYWNILKGSVLPEHSHYNEQISQVITGELELTIEGEKMILHAGKTAIIPAYAKHSGLAISDCFVIDVFSPSREDYKLL